MIAGAGCAVTGGFYVAFSAVVMPALRRRPAKDAIATMVSINQMAVRAPFMILFFGTAAACVAVAVVAAADPLARSPIRVAGAASYLAGWASTIAVNVPLNNRLSEAIGDQPGQQWSSYEQSWTPANHIRAALSVAGAVGLLISVSHP